MDTNNEPQSTTMPAVKLEVINGHPMASSIDVAKTFGKLHKNVIRDIERLEVPRNWAGLNFEPGSYADAQGQMRPMVNMTRDGFTILAMGFTGSKAMRFKIAYIEAFNAMEAELMARSHYAGGQQLPAPGLSMDAIAGLCREADKYLKGKASLRALHYFTGMPVADLLAEIETPEPSTPGAAATLTRYLAQAIAAGGHGLSTGSGQDGDWVQGTATQFCHAFASIAMATGIPVIFRNAKHLGELLAKESESLAQLGWLRTGAVRTVHGYREHRFTRLAATKLVN